MDNKYEFHHKSESLNNISRPYAERIMDEAINKSLRGTTV